MGKVDSLISDADGNLRGRKKKNQELSVDRLDGELQWLETYKEINKHIKGTTT